MGHTSACPSLPAVDIFNLVRYGAAAMRPLATSSNVFADVSTTTATTTRKSTTPGFQRATTSADTTGTTTKQATSDQSTSESGSAATTAVKRTTTEAPANSQCRNCFLAHRSVNKISSYSSNQGGS